MQTRALRAMVHRRLEKAGVNDKERLGCHLLRHTFATRFYRQTKDIHKLQRLLGHSDISTTAIYMHVADEELDASMEAFVLDAPVSTGAAKDAGEALAMGTLSTAGGR